MYFGSFHYDDIQIQTIDATNDSNIGNISKLQLLAEDLLNYHQSFSSELFSVNSTTHMWP